MIMELYAHDEYGAILGACSVRVLMENGKGYALAPPRMVMMVGGAIARCSARSPDLDLSVDIPMIDGEAKAVRVGDSVTFELEAGMLFECCNVKRF